MLHGDYHPINIILRNNKLVIFDWEGIEFGDNRYDISFSALAGGVFGGIEVENYLFSEYAKHGLSIHDMDYFIVNNALHRVVKLYRVLTKDFGEYELYSGVFLHLKNRIEQITGLKISLNLG